MPSQVSQWPGATARPLDQDPWFLGERRAERGQITIGLGADCQPKPCPVRLRGGAIVRRPKLLVSKTAACWRGGLEASVPQPVADVAHDGARETVESAFPIR